YARRPAAYWFSKRRETSTLRPLPPNSRPPALDTSCVPAVPLRESMLSRPSRETMDALLAVCELLRRLWLPCTDRSPTAYSSALEPAVDSFLSSATLSVMAAPDSTSLLLFSAFAVTVTPLPPYSLPLLLTV